MTNALQLFQRSHDMPATKTSYAIGKSVPLSYEEAVERIRAALQRQGFGVLTEIDVRATLKQKLDVDFKKYVILGACNPPLAYRGFQAEDDIGLLLPCNVVVYEEDEGGARSRVAVLDPLAQLGIAGREDIRPVAEEAQRRLEQALAELPG
jgi:uncharacterized protein (DUF302 family)